MVTPGVNAKEARVSARLALQCSIIVANGVQASEGRVLNLSKHGCLIESPLPIKAGDHLQLRLFLPESDQSVRACVIGHRTLGSGDPVWRRISGDRREVSLASKSVYRYGKRSMEISTVTERV